MKSILKIGLLLMAIVQIHIVANASPSKKMQYSADKVVQKQNIVDLIGNAEVILGNQKITGNKITLNLKTKSAKVTGIARFTSDNMRVNLIKNDASSE